jgi:hypothetical protein
MIYKSKIQPHIDYCSSIILLANEGEIRSLQLLKNRAMRIILKKARKTHQMDAGCVGLPRNQTTSEFPCTYIAFQN